VALFGLLMALQLAVSTGPTAPPISYSDLFQLAANGQVESVTIEGQRVTGRLGAPHSVGGVAVTAFSSRLP
jgi:hypothetical protein